MEATAPPGPPLVGLSLEGPRPQRRLTVGFRIILAIPHFLYLIVLSIVAVFAAVAAWVGALVLGRMPDGLGDFLGRIVQYATRVNAYLYLLTDRYPPFSLAGDYPVTVLLPPRGRLNRAAVFFRLILFVPALIVVSLVSSGLQLSMLIIWLIVVISSRMPTPAFEAVASFLRYETRAYAWLLMLTSEYPSGLFGDGPTTAPPDGPGLEPASGALQPDPAASSLPAPPPPPTAAPRITRIVLSKAGKRLMVVFLVVGILVTAGQIAVALATGGQSDRALRDLEREYTEVVRSSQEYGAAVQSCGLSSVGADCLRIANKGFAVAVRDFREDLVDVDFPGYALDAARDLRDAADQVVPILDGMAATSDPAAYEALVAQLQVALSQMDAEASDLHDLLRLGF